MRITYTHWLPIITRCPVNGLPDVLWAEVTSSEMAELYMVRDELFGRFFMKLMFMEDVAREILRRAKQLNLAHASVKVSLAFGKHVVRVD